MELCTNQASHAFRRGPQDSSTTMMVTFLESELGWNHHVSVPLNSMVVQYVQVATIVRYNTRTIDMIHSTTTIRSIVRDSDVIPSKTLKNGL